MTAKKFLRRGGLVLAASIGLALAGCSSCSGTPEGADPALPTPPTDGGLVAEDGPGLGPDDGARPEPPVEAALGVDVDISAYPMLDDVQLGQLRWVLNLFNQPLDDFRNFETDVQGQLGMAAYRYSIAFGVYYLAYLQYHKLPAWSEAIQPAIDRAIQKILQRPVWEYWATESRGVPMVEPNLNRPYPESHDPVGDKNVMYSGHLGHMINLYETLYRDSKWDGPGSLVFQWTDTEKYVYDNRTLEQVMYQQMRNNLYHGICCEPNEVFSQCNQHPILSFFLFDSIHGTHLAEVSSEFLAFMLEKQMFDPVTHEVVSVYLVKQDKTVTQDDPTVGNLLDPLASAATQLGFLSLNLAAADGWTGSFMHAWQPALIEPHYPFWKNNHVVQGSDGRLLLKDESTAEAVGRGLSFGFFALLASELGDLELRDRIIEQADNKYQPQWRDGMFYYSSDLTNLWGTTSVSDKLLALARLGVKDGLLALHAKPMGDSHFAAPMLAGVDLSQWLVRRAFWDETQRLLAITVQPTTPRNQSAGIEIRQLNPSQRYMLIVDGSDPEPHEGSTSLPLTLGLDKSHDLIVAAR
jgi:hypothetical protein